MKQTTIIAIVLAVLLLVSGVQAYQLTSLKSKINDGQLAVSSAKSATPLASSGGSGVPESIKDLPSMVGGC